jgi:lysozyme family protein
MNFDRAVAFVIHEEGGYVNDPADPGGETKFGISKRAYPSIDIKNLTVEQAKTIYRRDYWNPLQLDARKYGPALCLFDCAVNQGLGRARQLLARVATSSQPFIVAFQSERALHYAGLPTFARFGRGWMRRLLRVTIEATKGDA